MPNKGNRATGIRDVIARGTTSVIHQTAISKATQKVYPILGLSGENSTNRRRYSITNGVIMKLINFFMSKCRIEFIS
jgi:hypothetical protein